MAPLLRPPTSMDTCPPISVVIFPGSVPAIFDVCDFPHCVYLFDGF